jgi:hypothetical protein
MLCAVFCFWYKDCGGPLEPKAIDHYMELLYLGDMRWLLGLILLSITAMADALIGDLGR